MNTTVASSQFDRYLSVNQLFEQHAQDNPTYTAVVFEGQSYSYQQINQQANQLAHFLRTERQVGADEWVGIYIDQSHSHWQLIALLAVLKSGGGYLPLDVSLSLTQIQSTLTDAAVRTVLSTQDFIGQLNTLQWEVEAFEAYVLLDDDNVYAVQENNKNSLGDRELWEYFADKAISDISAGGWSSSYTGLDLSRQEVDEYADNIVNKLMPLLTPQTRVLELGCASGVSMFRLAPHVAHYVGTDISRAIIEHNKQRCRDENVTNISLYAKSAIEISQIAEIDFDIVIINSVIQAFDGHNYLRQVIDMCIDKLADKGQLFLGDLMDQASKADFINDLILYKATGKSNYVLAELNKDPQNRPQTTKTDLSSELFVAKGFFEDLLQDRPVLRDVTFSDKTGVLKNELTEFRYDVLFSVDKQAGVIVEAGTDSASRHKHQYDRNGFAHLSIENLDNGERSDRRLVNSDTGIAGLSIEQFVPWILSTTAVLPATQLAYWTKQLNGIAPVHTLPLDHVRADNKCFSAQVIAGSVDSDVGARLQQLAVDNQVTPFMLLHSALALVLARHSNSQDIVIGTPVVGQVQADFARLTGESANHLVLRTRTDHLLFSDYLADVKQVNLDAQANQGVPFEQLLEQLVEDCQVPRSSAYTPLFQIMFDMNTKLPLMQGTDAVATFDLQLSAQIINDEIRLLWIYDVALFTSGHIEQLNQHLQCLLTALASYDKSDTCAVAIADLPMLSSAEQQVLLSELNDTQVSYDRDTLVHQLFDAQVARQPEAVAVLFDAAFDEVNDQQQLSYQALNQQANRLAHYLIELGVKPDTLVGVCVERSMASMVALLAILKAGGAYVPLDPDYPSSRLSYMIQDSQIELVLTQSNLLAHIGRDDIHCLVMDNIDALVADYESKTPVVDNLTADSLAYMIYTSGSTGQPKGAQVRHGNMTNLLHWYRETYAFDQHSRTLIISSMAFDLTQKNLFTPLICGGAVCLAPAGHYDAVLYRQLIVQQNISHINCAPSACYGLTDDGEAWSEIGATLKWILLGGEPIESAWVQKWVDYSSKKPALINMYGPTECTDIACQFEITPAYWRNHGCTPIGKPNANVRLYVLDAQQSLVPYGAVGELCIAGLSVGAGYLGRPELSADKFITRSVGSNGGEELLYRTGDLVRYHSDGNLLFVGRIDDQVNMRGFRIELGEIEHQLSACDAVAASVVLIQAERPAQQSLVAYVERSSEVEVATLEAQLKQHLLQCLPEYMVPSAFVFVDQWPLTPNGKTDKKALSALADNRLFGMPTVQVVKAQTETEQHLVNIWAELLNIDASSISTTVDFFELGGHSLLTVKMLAQIRTQLGQELSFKTVFEASGIGEIASAIDADLN